ncbi:DJ-1/PfpI family protein [Paenibacillus radicis (ex Xue et al. 2023)]|uniref:DJ-1/PfpI family protein n=1 Tax=Paenibacillus radicis (ex Xue et al. 2023) TaxID=2972489 RepID=A0ABT1YS53_9BACL|nr:DJ-1/PfpI family protein [Paenibacillus radicis (ex Xue et al. 2023)]MCR8636011.1 DJ-1/PfpI family protein [Paenibacillus radicis (ex Xue et al. 2023)]
MKMAFVLFDRMTTLDFSGFFEAITWLKMLNAMDDVSWHLCSTTEEIKDDRGMTIKINHVRPDLSAYDLLFIPGGMATRQLQFDKDFVAWLQTAQDVKYKISVCTGALLLGAAGFLKGKRATTNPSAYELLVPYCSEVVKQRVVRDGNIFTGGGVSASIDLGLYVIESLTNTEIAKKVQQNMDYPYYETGRLNNLDNQKAN